MGIIRKKNLCVCMCFPSLIAEISLKNKFFYRCYHLLWRTFISQCFYVQNYCACAYVCGFYSFLCNVFYAIFIGVHVFVSFISQNFLLKICRSVHDPTFGMLLPMKIFQNTLVHLVFEMFNFVFNSPQML